MIRPFCEQMHISCHEWKLVFFFFSGEGIMILFSEDITNLFQLHHLLPSSCLRWFVLQILVLLDLEQFQQLFPMQSLIISSLGLSLLSLSVLRLGLYIDCKWSSIHAQTPTQSVESQPATSLQCPGARQSLGFWAYEYHQSRARFTASLLSEGTTIYFNTWAPSDTDLQSLEFTTRYTRSVI